MSRDVAPAPVRPRVRGRRSSFGRDVATVAGRALRSIPRGPEEVISPLLIGVFFLAVSVGALSAVIAQGPGLEYEEFMLPAAVLLALTGLSRASILVLDVQGGYLDRLMVTPVHRLALLVGLLAADLALMAALAAVIVAVGLIVGVEFESGPLGVCAFLVLATAWGLAYAGFPYAIALKTGSPVAVNSSFLLFFPFVFLTTTFVPLELLSGWLEAAATVNPVTYLLVGMRSLISDGWHVGELAEALAAIAGVGTIGIGLALLSLGGRLAAR